jgi:CRP-like cAMP-binding protein
MIAIMSDWQTIFEDAPVRPHDAGTTLFIQGAPVTHILLLRSGSVALERHLPSGDPFVLHVAEAGDLLADASLFAEAYHCDGVVWTNAAVASMPKERFLRRLRDAPEAMMALLARASHEVQGQRARVEILRLKRLGDRLDVWLELHGHPKAGGWIRVAEAIGVSPPALYRELARRRTVGDGMHR